MVTPVVCPSRHQPLLPLGWPVDGASCQASGFFACFHVHLVCFNKCLEYLCNFLKIIPHPRIFF
jgi:hypothetical protein